MAAVMASDSQILALSTMFTEDIFAFYQGAARFGHATQVLTGRIFVVIVTTVAYVIAMRIPQSIFDVATQYAFAGYSALTPLLVAALFWMIHGLRSDMQQRFERGDQRETDALTRTRDELAQFKIEVARTYVPLSLIRDLDRRISDHMIRIEVPCTTAFARATTPRYCSLHCARSQPKRSRRRCCA